MNKTNTSLTITLILLIILFISLFGITLNRYNTLMFRTANGFYNEAGKFYCVKTEKRVVSQINRSDTHEKCHVLVSKNYWHYCFI